VADFLKHLAEFTIAPLDQHHLVPRVIALPHLPDPRRGRAHASFAGFAALNAHPAPQNVQLRFAGLTAHLHQISLLDSRSSLGQLVGQFAVVRHQQQALTLVVEPPHRVKPLRHLGEELHDRRPAFRILHRRYVALGLVQHKIALPFRPMQQLAVHANVVAASISLSAQLGHYLAVYLHAALFNQFLGPAATRHPSTRQDLLQPFQLGRRPRCRCEIRVFFVVRFLSFHRIQLGVFVLCVFVLRDLACGISLFVLGFRFLCSGFRVRFRFYFRAFERIIIGLSSQSLSFGFSVLRYGRALRLHPVLSFFIQSHFGRRLGHGRAQLHRFCCCFGLLRFGLSAFRGFLGHRGNSLFLPAVWNQAQRA
jgi:hypothetical protein